MSRAEQYLDFMVCVLWADGTVSPEEREHLFRSVLYDMDFRPGLVEKYEHLLAERSRIDPEEVIRQVVATMEPVGLVGLVRDAYIMASVDGDILPAEVDVIRSLLKAAGVPEERFSEIDAWGREAVSHVRRGVSLFRTEPVESLA